MFFFCPVRARFVLNTILLPVGSCHTLDYCFFWQPIQTPPSSKISAFPRRFFEHCPENHQILFAMQGSEPFWPFPGGLDLLWFLEDLPRFRWFLLSESTLPAFLQAFERGRIHRMCLCFAERLFRIGKETELGLQQSAPTSKNTPA